MNDKDFDILLVKQPIDDLRKDIVGCLDYFSEHMRIDGSRNRSKMKTFCRMVYNMLLSRFAQGMYMVEKTKRRFNAGMNSDNEIILANTSSYAYSVVVDIYSRLDKAIPLTDFPSCKHMLSMENDAMKKYLKEICRNPIIMRLLNLGALANDMYDAIVIFKIFAFYRRYISEIEREIKDEKWTLCELEQWLLDKANAECGYCYIASLKLGVAIPKDLKDVVDDIKAHNAIDEYETKWQVIESKFLIQPTLSR